MSAATGRAVAYLSRLEWRGILRGLRPGWVQRRSGATWVQLLLETEDTDHPGETWATSVEVRLPDGETDEQWSRRLLIGLADSLGHELGEALWVDGRPAASPHERPRVWPWRVADREEQ